MYDNLSFVGAACLFCEAGEKTVIYSAEMFIFTDIIDPVSRKDCDL